MSGLIRRQDAIYAIIDELMPSTPLSAVIRAKNRFKDLPAVQPEREHEKWIYGEHDVSMCVGYRCDKCGFFVPWDYQHKSIDFINDYHFCPSCGADMRGKKHEQT